MITGEASHKSFVMSFLPFGGVARGCANKSKGARTKSSHMKPDYRAKKRRISSHEDDSTEAAYTSSHRSETMQDQTKAPSHAIRKGPWMLAGTTTRWRYLYHSRVERWPNTPHELMRSVDASKQ